MCTKYKHKDRKEYMQTLCNEIQESTSGVSVIVKDLRRKDPTFPCLRSIRLWIEKYPDLQKTYRFAKEMQAETFVDDVMDIAHGFRNPSLQLADVTRIDKHIQANKWMVSILNPYKYGDNQDYRLAQLEQKLEKLEESKKNA